MNQASSARTHQPRGQGTYTQHLQLAFAEPFMRSLLQLSKTHHERVLTAIDALRQGLPSVKLHDVGHFKGFHAAGKAVVVVCVQEGKQLLLFYAAPHDEAYDWGLRHKFSLVGEAIVLRELQTDAGEEPSEAAKQNDFVAPVSPKPLEQLRIKDLERFGITQSAAAFLREVPDWDCLFGLAECFHPALGNAIIDLADAPEALDKALRQFEDASQPSESRLSAAIANPRNAHLVWNPPQSEQGLLAALQGEFEAWRIFLHPSQRRVVERQTKGAYKLSGGPGTGKTVVAVHRARFLAEQVFADEPRPILLTAFSNALTAELRSLLAKLCADKPELLQRFEVQTLSGTARSLLEKAGIKRQLLTQLDDCWKRAMAVETLGLPESFYRSEREHVLVAHGAWTRPQYLQVRRTGRSQKLSNRAQRLAVMDVFEEFERTMLEQNGGDDAALAREATLLLRSGKLGSPYAAVICDELQDAAPAQLRMLAALTADAEQGSTRANALFLCGDGHQRLYTAPVTLKQCGIDIVGRSASLKLNYRTTEGIRRHAMALVQGLELDALEQETNDSFSHYRSLRGGPPPVEHLSASPDEEALWLAQLCNPTDEPNTTPHQQGLLLVLARTKDYLQQLKARLNDCGLRPRLLESNDALSPSDQLVLCTLHRSKGLEAPRVVIAGAQLIPMRYPGKGDDSERALWKRKETCLLYVGLTRARDWCAVSRVADA